MRISKLKRKIAILKQKEGIETERKKLEIEHAELKHREKTKVFAMKHKKTIAIVKTVAVGAGRIGRGLGGMLKGLRESPAMRRQYEAMYGKPKKRIAIIKKKKRKR